MFKWLKRDSAPTTSKANPGRSLKLSITFANAEKNWSEAADIMSCMASVLKSGGYSYSLGKSWFEVDSGLIVQPRFASLRPLEKGGVQTVTTVETSHPSAFPAGVFEYQHSTGDNAQNALAKGFESWMQFDLPVFLDALTQKPKHCALLQFALPEAGGSPARKRRVVLGPVAHLVTQPQTENNEEHPFCPCCLFTNTATVMKSKVSDGGFYGIRLFAMRGKDGLPAADCRLNGEDWDEGKSALTEYVKSWPDRGVEFRKQYVIVQNDPISDQLGQNQT